jgi:protein gp37
MSTKTKIEWTDQTWNPTIGCDKVSPGCANCYADVMAKRLKAMRMKGYENGFQLKLMPERLDDPIKRKKPTIYFVNSMSDVFHKDVPDDYILKIMDVIRESPQHIYQILTKRADRMAEFFKANISPDNAWLGVSVENRKHGLPRIDYLRTVPARVRFISAEPLLEDLGEIDLTGINWVIVGGESGPKARKMEKDWALNIRNNCLNQNSLFFFKQWGGWGEDGLKRDKKKNGRLLNGLTWDDTPKVD